MSKQIIAVSNGVTIFDCRHINSIAGIVDGDLVITETFDGDPVVAVFRGGRLYKLDSRLCPRCGKIEGYGCRCWKVGDKVPYTINPVDDMAQTEQDACGRGGW